MQLTINQKERKILTAAGLEKFTGNLDLKKYSMYLIQDQLMEPAIPDGGICLIDKNDRTFYEGGIYVCRIKTDWSDELVIRRIFIKDRKNLVLRCDNQKFGNNTDYVFPAAEKEYVIIARVSKILRDI